MSTDTCISEDVRMTGKEKAGIAEMPDKSELSHAVACYWRTGEPMEDQRNT